MVEMNKIVYRDQIAKISSLDKIFTPNIFFISTPHVFHPSFAEFILKMDNIEYSNIGIVLEDEEECPLVTPLGFPETEFKNYKLIINLYHKYIDNNEDSLVILPYGRQISENPPIFVDKILAVRKKIGWEKLLYVPCVGSPMSYALLVYMGIDFFDSINAINAARRRELLFPLGNYSVDELDEIPCNCPACREEVEESFSFEDVLQHNYYMIYQELKIIRNTIKKGKLRELVEQRIRAKPELISMLRFFDKKGFREIERYTPIVKPTSFLVITEDSFNRVEVKRFQQRVMDRYTKPMDTSILLLLPCSYRKPYSFSPSHKRFKFVLQDIENRYSIHEVIITSPLGVVPRELELVYPVAQYDIPVTGDWSEYEKKMIQNLLKRYLENNRYREVVIYLPEKLRKITSEVVRDPIVIESKENLTSRKILDKLLEVLEELTDKYPYIPYDKRRLEDMKSFLSYQFGMEIADTMLRDSIIKGRYPNLRIISNGKQIGMLTQERGFVSLTLEGAKRLASTGKYYVEIDKDFKLKGSVFAPGVISADKEIRIGDEVCIIQDGKLCGVGVAKMPGEDMVIYRHGEAVDVRHRI